jgi:radical SAM family uncharacterized protein
MMSPHLIKEQIEKVLPTVQKPGRYTGGEYNQVVKDWTTIETKVALVFPDIYDLGMSNLGLAILYDQLNQRNDVIAERAYCPWSDMESVMRENSIPLYSLETKHALGDFDILGISLPYETLYTNTLNLLDLGGVPLYSKQRTEKHPLVLAGGHSCFNPEPMHAFIDAFVIGEGEEVMHEIIDTYQSWKKRNASRTDLLTDLSKLWGVYVPSLYKANYHEDGRFSHLETLYPGAPLPILKRIVGKLPPPTTRFIVPYIDIVHDRIPIEIMRGCTRGCRFCHAGWITRPLRERSVDEIINAIREGMSQTGYEEVGLLSLSSSDYTHILELVNAVNKEFSASNLSVSLPSLRIESFSVDLMDALKDTRRSGFTLAPEAATERMRNIINKPVSTQQLLNTARQVYSRGWTTIKLYFMIGHPSETIEDVEAIAQMCKAVLAEGRSIIGRKAKVNAGVSTFIPKPHTPFQWSSCDTFDQIEAKQYLLRRSLKGQGLKLNWNDPRGTMLEAALSRGDRRLAEVIHKAWESGARFDAWNEHFDFDLWQDAFNSTENDIHFYTHRPRQFDETFPWDHIDAGLRKQILLDDLKQSTHGNTRPDCRGNCYACGILPTFKDIRSQNPGEAWKCPEIKPVGPSDVKDRSTHSIAAGEIK